VKVEWKKVINNYLCLEGEHTSSSLSSVLLHNFTPQPSVVVGIGGVNF
jgi:hypothetical protein